MKLRLSYRLIFYIGTVFLVGFAVHVTHDVREDRRLLTEIGFKEAQRLSAVITDEVYTAMRLGGGRKETQALVQKFNKDLAGTASVKIIHGPAIDKQFGAEPDEAPADAHENGALEGRPSRLVEKDRDGYSVVRSVTPAFFKSECLSCHTGSVGAVAGAISVGLSIKEYESIVSSHARDSALWSAAIFVLISAAVLAMVRLRLLRPMEDIKDAATAIAAGDLTARANIRTRDEFEDLGKVFDGMVQSLYDTTKSLSEINYKYTMFVNAAVDAILLKDLETDLFVDANPAAQSLTGYTKEELTTMRAEELYSPQKYQVYRKVLNRWLYDGKGYLHDSSIIIKDGTAVPVEVAASVIEMNGRRYLQEVWRDISDRKGLEASLKKYVAHLEETVKERTAALKVSLTELEDAYGRLKNSEQKMIQSAKLASLGEMGAGIAHELNSPIAGILSISEVLIGRTVKEDPNYFLLTKIKEAAVRSKFIILDMMTYARPFKEAHKPIFLNSTIKATLAIFISELKAGRVDLVQNLDPNLPRVMGNMGQIMEIIHNIIKNARDAMEGQGRIFISTYAVTDPDGKMYSVAEIKDTGPGIPDEVKDRIFDPFFSTKEKGGGLNMGLGLSIAQSIVKEHGGRIEVESVPGNGASFKVFLPVAKEQGCET